MAKIGALAGGAGTNSHEMTSALKQELAQLLQSKSHFIAIIVRDC